MQCIFCKKEIDINKCEIPPTWFGRYKIDTLIEIICIDCIKIKLKEWRNRK